MMVCGKGLSVIITPLLESIFRRTKYCDRAFGHISSLLHSQLITTTRREQNSCLEAWNNIISQRKCPCWCLYGSAEEHVVVMSWESNNNNNINDAGGREKKQNPREKTRTISTDGEPIKLW